MKIPTKEPKVSIIIVNYNNAKFLIKSIKSALSQTYKFKEVIVVDDNSTDNSIKILNKFKKHITIHRNKKRTTEGSFNQINCYYKGFLKSKGDYLFFLDSDDFYKKNKIKSIMNEFKKTNLDIIFDLPIWKYNNILIKKKFTQKKFAIFSWPRFTPQSCISVKKKFAKELFTYLKIKKFETIWFDFRIASYTFLKNKDVYICQKYLTYYRQLDSSASKKFKTFSKNWWYRRNQAHDFIMHLKIKFKIKNVITLDRLITRIINFILL